MGSEKIAEPDRQIAPGLTTQEELMGGLSARGLWEQTAGSLKRALGVGSAVELQNH